MGLFKQKSRTPVELVQHVRRLLPYTDPNTDLRETKRQTKMCKLRKDILEMRRILYGEDRPEPLAEASERLSEEFFREDTLPLLIASLHNLDSGARTDVTQVIASLLSKRFNGRSLASEYLELNTDVLDMLIKGYEDPDVEVALCMCTILKDCIRHQVVASYILGSDHIKKFFDYVHIPNFDVAADAATAFKELLTRHKSTAAEFLSRNYDWFFVDYNSLLESDNYAIRRSAVELLGAILLDRSNTSVMVRYVSSLDNMRILMNLLRDSSKSIQLEAFHVFKLFPANQNKPPDIVNILVGNRNKLLRFFQDFSFDKEDEQFKADKAQVVREIASLEPIVQTTEEVPC